jgi:single stranded DNA-binding protein
MFNTITIFGNLVRDVELKVIRDDLSVAKFSIAHSKGIKQKDGTWKNEATFIDCVYFSDKVKNLTKGTGVIITGHLKQENWVHAETGVNKSKLVIMVEDVLVASKITSFRNSDNESTTSKEFEQLESSKFNKINKMLESIELDVAPSSDLPF